MMHYAPPVYPTALRFATPQIRKAWENAYPALVKEYYRCYGEYVSLLRCRHCGGRGVGAADSGCGQSFVGDGEHVVTREGIYVTPSFKCNDDFVANKSGDCRTDGGLLSSGVVGDTASSVGVSKIHSGRGGQGGSVENITRPAVRGANYEKNRRKRDNRRKSALLIDRVVERLNLVETKCISPLDEEIKSVRLNREKHQEEISKLFLENQREKISRNVVENQVAKLRAEQQLKLWDSSDDAVARKKAEMIARSEINIVKSAEMKSRAKSTGLILDWSSDVKSGSSEPPSEVSSKPSIKTAVSVNSSASSKPNKSCNVVARVKPVGLTKSQLDRVQEIRNNSIARALAAENKRVQRDFEAYQNPVTVMTKLKRLIS